MSRNEFTTPLIVDENTVRGVLPSLDVQSTLAAMFRALGEDNAVQPPQTLTLFPAQAGDFITYLGAMAQAKVFGAKLSPYIVTAGRPIVTAWTALMSMETGQPLMWCDAGLLTTERTAGTTALAVGHLAAAGARHLAIVGSGAIAQAHLRHVARLRPWESIRVFSPDLSRNTAKQAAFSAIDARATFSASVEDCVRDADVVMLCTSSGTPVLQRGAITQPALVTSISTNVVNAHEIDPAWLTDMDVYCDYRRTTPGSAGEMKLAAERHGWSAQRVAGDLPELFCGTCPVPSYEKPVFFRSIGLGLEDVAIAYGLLQRLRGPRDA
ncbi:ornithine cyclodeaminase family protein [Paraburkholderia saeva]|uniref:ornithine cyclodeaminase family protein n=1 Tax=Paraburkholderia saeva TaxID=2777537 RepID=UPI001D7402F6|nr:ornithine cyclodeaminase family protein [Paraburkholderia saeva]CAG4909501.1 NAD(P)H-dependent anabolic L-arginine dehydrogenase DauB [Paraburkholderia saeva]